MAVFSIQLDNDSMEDYLRECNYRLQEENLINNPFRGKIAKLKNNVYVIRMKPIYARFYLAGYFILIMMLLFVGWCWYMVFPVCLILTGIFWNKYFFYVMIRLGLRKREYSGKIRLLGYDEMIKRCLEYINAV